MCISWTIKCFAWWGSFSCCRWTYTPSCQPHPLPSVWQYSYYSSYIVCVRLRYLCPDQCGYLQSVSALRTLFCTEMQQEVLQGHLTTYQVHLSVVDNKHVSFRLDYRILLCTLIFIPFDPYPTAFPYGNGMVLHFYQQQESSTTKTVHKVINKGLKAYV